MVIPSVGLIVSPSHYMPVSIVGWKAIGDPSSSLKKILAPVVVSHESLLVGIAMVGSLKGVEGKLTLLIIGMVDGQYGLILLGDDANVESLLDPKESHLSIADVGHVKAFVLNTLDDPIDRRSITEPYLEALCESM